MSKTSKGYKSAGKRQKALTAPQLAAVAALMTAPTLRQAAQRANVGESTLRGWLRDDDLFKAAIQELQSETLEALKRNLIAVNQAALARVLAVMGDPLAPHGATLGAAKLIFDQTSKMVESTEIMEMLKELETLRNDQRN